MNGNPELLPVPVSSRSHSLSGIFCDFWAEGNFFSHWGNFRSIIVALHSAQLMDEIPELTNVAQVLLFHNEEVFQLWNIWNRFLPPLFRAPSALFLPQIPRLLRLSKTKKIWKKEAKAAAVSIKDGRLHTKIGQRTSTCKSHDWIKSFWSFLEPSLLVDHCLALKMSFICPIFHD